MCVWEKESEVKVGVLPLLVLCHNLKDGRILLRVWSIAERYADAMQPVQAGATVQQGLPAETQGGLRESRRRLVMLLSL